jgi:hypothetical protein
MNQTEDQGDDDQGGNGGKAKPANDRSAKWCVLLAAFTQA